MAIGVTRVNGDTAGVENVDAGRSFANAKVINTGIASPIQAFNIQIVAGNLAAELSRGTDGTAGGVETLLNHIATNASIIAYQVDAGATAANTQLSVVVERSSWTALSLQQSIRASLGANIGSKTPVTTTTLDVRNVGIKLAAS
jgi:hypothetical protein